MRLTPSVWLRKWSDRHARAGFTLFEAIMVLIIVAVVVGALTPSVSRQLSQARVNRAVNIVAADLFMAQSLASRLRLPVSVTVSAGARTITIASPSATLATRNLGTTSDFKLSALTASPTSVRVMPSGLTNSTITITVTGGGYSRQVRMTQAGLVRIL